MKVYVNGSKMDSYLDWWRRRRRNESIGVICVDVYWNGLIKKQWKNSKHLIEWGEEAGPCLNWSKCRFWHRKMKMYRNSKFENIMVFIGQTVDTADAITVVASAAAKIKSQSNWNVYLLLLFSTLFFLFRHLECRVLCVRFNSNTCFFLFSHKEITIIIMIIMNW